MVDIFVVNALIYIVTFLYILCKYKKFNLYVAVWLFEAFIALMGMILVKSGLHYSESKTLGYKVSPIPYIFMYISNLIMTAPLRRVKSTTIEFSKYSDSKFIGGIVYLSILVVIPLCILKGVEAYIMNTIGLGEAYVLSYQGESMFTYTNPFLHFLSTWGATYCNLFAPIIALFYISRLSNNKGSYIVNFVGVGLAFMPAILSALAKGSKGALFFVAFDLLFYYIICSELMSKKIKRVIKVFGVLLMFLLVIWAVAIQGGRNDMKRNSVSVEEVFFQYLGESMPNVGWEVYDKVKWHPNGRRFFSDFFDKKGDRSTLSHADWHEYWSKKIGIRVEKFHTFWGDCYMEYGLLGSMLYIIFVTFLWDKLVFRYSNNISWIPLIAFYYRFFVIHGVFGHGGFTGSRQHVFFMYLIVVCVLINFFIRRKRETIISA